MSCTSINKEEGDGEQKPAYNKKKRSSERLSLKKAFVVERQCVYNLEKAVKDAQG